MGKDTDVNLVTLILEETWDRAREENKEVWRHKAGTFRSSRVTGQTESNKIGKSKLTRFGKVGGTNFTEFEESKSAQVGNTEATKAL